MVTVRRPKTVAVPRTYTTISPEKVKRTVYIQRPGGLMGGRRVVPLAQSDRTRVIRMKRDFDVNKDGRIDSKNDLKKGEVIGRAPTSGPVQSPVRVVRHHWRRTKQGRMTRVEEHTRVD